MPSNQFHRVEKLVGDNEDWQDATLEGTWSTAGGRTVQYYKDKFNIVHIRGACTGGTGDIFSLPEGYWPNQAGFFCCYQGGAAEVSVKTDGDVVLTVAGTGGISLDPISFRADG